MQKYLEFISILFLLASNILLAEGKFAKNIECKSCHPNIYEEYQNSMHSKSTILKDEIHQAVWNLHPAKKSGKYSCSQCHTPTDNNEKVSDEAVSCAYCHRIEAIELRKKSNKNIISKNKQEYFGTLKDNIKSPFHKSNTKNINFKNGNICIGCHSHKQNKAQLNVCSTNIDNELNGLNCVSCHMPKVFGPPSELYFREKHTFHGFPAVHSNNELLAKYVDIKANRNINNNKNNSFQIIIHNKSSHSFLLHPLRVAILKVKIQRDGKIIKKFQDRKFMRIIGDKGKATPPWLATEVVIDTMIKQREIRKINYNFKLKKDDKILVTLGYFLINPKMLKSLKLDKSRISKKFFIFKRESL